MHNYSATHSKIPSAPAGYKIIDVLGQGGFGQVFKALNLNTQQSVAIKFLTVNTELDATQHARHLARFQREAQLTATLDHPNIVRLLEKGQMEDNQLFAIFEYVEGCTLRDYLSKNGPFAPVEAAEIMAQILDALAHAHNKGVIHRDIKPSNIMLTRSGLKQHVKILDFGIGTFQKDARQAGFQTLTLTQETLGTPSYSAPEQLRGEPPTPKTDLYLWGLVFIECLTGRPAVSGNSIAAIFHKQLNSENISMPQELASHPCATLLRRVLQKKASDRAARADEIYQELKFINFSSLVFPVETIKRVELAADAPNVEDTVINLGKTTASVNAERKQITFLAVRTGLNGLIQSQSDDEVIDTLLRDHKNSIVDVAQRFGGYFVGNLGSLLLFYFGYPSVSENDSRLAARAALEISTGAMQRGGVLCAQQGFNFTVHLGFHSARLTTYPDTVPEGRCVDFALDLASMALPNQILCSETAKNILDIYIEFERHKLALNEPVYEMSGERQLEAMGFLRANRTAYDMVGRDQELQQLINYSINSPTNAPSIMHVYGEAGIGKSRLLLELRTRLKTCKQLIAQCLPEHQYSGLHPLLVLLRNWYGLDSVADDFALERIKTALMASGIEEQAASLAVLAVWLDIPLPPATYPIVSSKEHRKVLFAGIFSLIDEIFKSYSPTVLILEDIHWADSLTLEFIRKVAAPSDEFNHSIKLITTSRQRGISELTCQELEVLRLDSIQMEVLIQAHTQSAVIAPKLLQVLIERADGVPFYAEELINSLMQRGLIHRLNGVIDWVGHAQLDRIPLSLSDSLQQKLDNLTFGKETAQIASVIGREFDYELLLNASAWPDEKIQLDLQALIDADLIFVRRRAAGYGYIFKHALVRDAAYESMSNSVREHWHGCMAEVLSTDVANKNTVMLAMHWAKAQKYLHACECALQSAELALQRSSAAEVIAVGEEIVGWSAKLDEGKKAEITLAVYRLLTAAYMESKGWASEEVRYYSESALDLLKTQNKVNDLVPQLWWQVLGGVVGGKRGELSPIIAEMNLLFPEVELINQAAIRCAQGFYYFAEGQRENAVRCFLDSITCYDTNADISHQQTYGFDSAVFAKATLGRTYVDLDQRELAIFYVREAVADAKHYKNIPSIGIALMYYAIVFQQYGVKNEVERSSGELLILAEKHDMPIYKYYGQMLYDWSVDQIDGADAILAALINLGSYFAVGQFQSFYADTMIEQGDFEKALAKIDQCLGLNDAISEHYYRPHLLCKKALCLVQLGHEAGAEAVLDMAEQEVQAAGLMWLEKTIQNIKSELVGINAIAEIV